MLNSDALSMLVDKHRLPQTVVRSAALEALSAVPVLMGKIPIGDDRISSLLLLACHDVDDNNRMQAQEL